MTGEIIKILPFKRSRNKGSYLRVEFRLENGQWAKTDLVSKFRNPKRWRGLLKVGNIINDLEMKDGNTVNADSYPTLRENLDLSVEDEKLLLLSKQSL